MNFYFIAVNFNSFNFTKKYINSINNIKKNNSSDIKIIIVDNDSRKDELMKLEEFIQDESNVRLIKNRENIGYFKALNVGLMSIKDYKSVLLIIGNNDLTFNENFINNLNKLDYSKDILALAPDIITKDGKHQNPHVINRISLFKRFFYKIYYTNYYLGKLLYSTYQKIKALKLNKKNENKIEEQLNIYMGIGACYILTPNFFDYYDKLDDRVFMWGEEALFGNQIRKVNGKILYTPSLKVKHYESATVSKMPSKQKYEMTKKSYQIYSKYL